jgi:oleandomycin transport system permease protein
VDLAARTGTVLGLLGPNGAGKTTAVRVLATLLQPDGGHTTVGGYDVVRDAHQVRQLIGLTGQYASVDEALTGMENLQLIGRLLGMPRHEAKQRARELLTRFGLTDAAGRAARTYSGGMRRRLDLAASLVGRPQLFFLDEPTTGLDPRSRLDLWGLLRNLVSDGVTVLLTTQYLEEADELADEIAVIDHGRVIATGTPDRAPCGGNRADPRDRRGSHMTATIATAPPTRELASRVRPVDGLRQTMTLAWRTLVQIRRNPWELSDFSIQPIMFVLLFTYVFGGAISGSPANYLTLALPGIIVMNMFFVATYVGMGFNTDLTKGVFDRLRSLPLARWAPLTGRILADLVKQVWSIVLLFAVGSILGFRIGTSIVATLSAVALILVFALAFSWVSILVGVLAKDPEKVQIFSFTVLFPLTFVSNVFVPTHTMPDWLQPIVNANPVTLLADGCRGLMVGGPVAGSVLGSLLWAAVIMAVFAPLSLRALKRRV